MALVAHRILRRSAACRVMTLAGSGLSLLLISGCSSDPVSEPKPRPTDSSSASSSSSDKRFLKLEKQAMEAVNNDTVEDADLVEAGSEQLVDGIHTRPLLDKGKSYQLAVVCVGTGKAQMVLKYNKVEKREMLTCDGAVSYLRISDAPKRIKLDVDATDNSTGATAWRISRVHL
ncbi:hypothetical protein [Streptomyces sp. NPDC055287]